MEIQFPWKRLSSTSSYPRAPIVVWCIDSLLYFYWCCIERCALALLRTLPMLTLLGSSLRKLIKLCIPRSWETKHDIISSMHLNFLPCLIPLAPTLCSSSTFLSRSPLIILLLLRKSCICQLMLIPLGDMVFLVYMGVCILELSFFRVARVRSRPHIVHVFFCSSFTLRKYLWTDTNVGNSHVHDHQIRFIVP